MMQVACALSDHRQAFFCANSDVLVLWAKLLGAQAQAGRTREAWSLEDRVTSREDGGWADQGLEESGPKHVPTFVGTDARKLPHGVSLFLVEA